ncbi:uncharacterized protein ASPGLDRAFT_39633 [Aspergillus glaucus CBS 516.65]|uniref:Uncharacterized protein n=1 Tax=Aspergillus glaucus CBS 516.65 TaxID=1160497 RepID=A0A1L9V793_ASPGL|nr:hypothetical protein ASPGLDRAFT_39633 [Aspergillus glaucus CBS 516.65]OJJ79775.1 hypothetical protein ASPGLDRAFT_39633 [Aspergillus glaucus CBS 516.65]
MPEYRASIRYTEDEAYAQHGRNIETLTQEKLGEKRASEFSLMISTRSLPPSHSLMFQAPATVPLEDLQSVKLADGIVIDVESADN